MYIVYPSSYDNYDSIICLTWDISIFKCVEIKISGLFLCLCLFLPLYSTVHVKVSIDFSDFDDDEWNDRK